MPGVCKLERTELHRSDITDKSQKKILKLSNLHISFRVLAFLSVGYHSFLNSFVGIYVSVVGTTLKTLILETNPFLVRTNGFTADLAFVGNRETRDGGHKYCFTSHSFLLVKFSSPKKIRQQEIGTNKRRSKRAIS